MFQRIPSKSQVRQALFNTLNANGMNSGSGAHVRLTLTRGEKVTSGMSPRNNQNGCTLIVLAEWKGSTSSAGEELSSDTCISLVSSTIRRNTPMCLDSKIHHNNLLNNILAKIEADIAVRH